MQELEPPQLILSALTWTGWPTTWSAGDEDQEIGKYTQGLSIRVNRVGANAELSAVEYSPAAGSPASFTYRRCAFTGTASSEITYYGSILPKSEISPLLRICLPSRYPWPERFRALEYVRIILFSLTLASILRMFLQPG
jgi:hypothetical protein